MTSQRPDLLAFAGRGNLLDVAIAQTPKGKRLLEKLGCLVTFKVLRGQGAIHRSRFVIGGVQRLFDNSIGYRVYLYKPFAPNQFAAPWHSDDFGIAARPEELIWL